MGKVRTEELENGNIGVEITYGGLESPYGGVDTSAPPPYIDPRCFTDVDGYIIINNRLACIAFEQVATPLLWAGDVTTKLLHFGTFYNSVSGQRNYALGYRAAVTAGPPSYVTYTFVITSWNPANIADFQTDTLPYTLFDSVGVPTAASITLGVIATNQNPAAAGTGAGGNITAVGAGGTITTFTVAGGTGYAVGDLFQIQQGTNVDQWAVVNTIGGGGSITAASLAGIPYGGYSVAPWTAALSVASSMTKLTIAGPGGTHTYTVAAANPSFTKQMLVAQFVSDINGLPDLNVKASASVDGFSLILTAQEPGAAGNNIFVQDTSVNHTVTLPPPLYFQCRINTPLTGGTDAGAFLAQRTIQAPISVADVGGVLYFAGLGPFILKFDVPGNFTVSTSEKGVGVLKKFGGSLIGLRDIPQLGEILQNQDMIFAWTAAQELDIWAPLDTNGLVTGAGFEQIADIGDYLSGLIVCNGTAFIIRAQGVSYATPSGSGQLPFIVNHIGLGDQGEGSQTSALVCQYDQVGAFVGNTDIFQVGGSIKAIGDKIKTAIYAALQTPQTYLDANACAVYLGGDCFTLVAFLINNIMYLFNTENGTWMTLTTPDVTPFTIDGKLLGTFSNENILAAQDQFAQTSMVVAERLVSHLPLFWAVTETASGNPLRTPYPSVSFVLEELLFGRDVTIDSLYVSLDAKLTSDVVITFLISEQHFGTLTLLHASYVNFASTPLEFQVFPDTMTNSSGVFTAHSPQLKITMSTVGDNINLLRHVKVSMFGSFDPKQRPV